MPNRYLVLSDLHLADFEEHRGAWRYYKSRAYDFDDTLAARIRAFVAETPAGTDPVLVLNGDIFDFDLVIAAPTDAPFRVSRSERRRGLRPTEARSAWKLRRILGDHPTFLDALVEVLAAGHAVIYVLGNHDRELTFEGVQQVLRDALAERARAQGLDTDPATWRLRFEPWFYYVPGEIYAEHGQQYDPYTAYRHICAPLIRRRGEWEVALPTGNLSNRYLMNRMGYFNPHASDYILNLFSYMAHWLRYYAFSRRSLMWNWFWGSLVVLAVLLRTKRQLRKPPPGCADAMERLRERAGLSPETLERLSALQRRPITSRLFRLVREFWLDRVIIAALMTGGTVALALTPIPLWIKLMVPLCAFPLAYLIYELLASGETIFSVEARLPGIARRIARMLDVPVVTFGHTHAPHLVVLDPGVTFVDTGTWAPITTRTGRALKPGFRNYLEIDFTEGRPRLHYDCAPYPTEPPALPGKNPARAEKSAADDSAAAAEAPAGRPEAAEAAESPRGEKP